MNKQLRVFHIELGVPIYGTSTSRSPPWFSSCGPSPQSQQCRRPVVRCWDRRPTLWALTQTGWPGKLTGNLGGHPM